MFARNATAGRESTQVESVLVLLLEGIDAFTSPNAERNWIEFLPGAGQRGWTKMLKCGHRFFRYAALITAMLCTMSGDACNVPVFRYALERWDADPYEVVIFHREPLTTEHQALLANLEQAGRDGLANVAVNRVSLTGQVSPPLLVLWNAQKAPTLPWMILRYPRQLQIEQSVWSGPFTAKTASTVIDSPLRRDISQKLLSGDAVVWLLLESGDKQRDSQAEQMIEVETKLLQQTLKLPEPSPQDPPISADLPLKIAFSTLRVSRSDPSEQMLVGMLLNRDTSLITTMEPMLFPVFGRGRVIPPAVGKEIRGEAIREMAEFLTGPCSCQVKEMNPGYDLLLSGNWNSLIGYQEVQLPEPPPLVSMSQFAATVASNVTEKSAQSDVSLASGGVSPARVEPDHLVRNLVVVLGIGVFFLATMTFVLKARANRTPS